MIRERLCQHLDGEPVRRSQTRYYPAIACRTQRKLTPLPIPSHPETVTLNPMAVTTIRANVPGRAGLQAIGLDGDTIAAVESAADRSPKDAANTRDWSDGWISLGGCDVQINGALGLAFPDVEPQHLPVLDQIGRYLWQAGIDEYLPTLVTTSVEKFQRSLAVFADFIHQQPPATEAAQIRGVHLEGPCLNPAKRGAHPQAFLRPLTADDLACVLGNYADLVTVMTLAPELDDSGRAIATLRDRNIVVSLGHSLATAAEANRAFDRGATMVTHAFNAMPGLHHREPGLLGAALVRDGVRCGFIADGQHVCPTMLQVLLNAAPDGLFLVSDALSPLGLPDGRYPWDEREIEVKQGTARLPNGTLAGTTRSLLDGALNLLDWNLCDIETAISLATIAPRQAIGQSSDLVGASVGQLLHWRREGDGQDARWRWRRLSGGDVSPNSLPA